MSAVACQLGWWAMPGPAGEDGLLLNLSGQGPRIACENGRVTAVAECRPSFSEFEWIWIWRSEMFEEHLIEAHERFEVLVRAYGGEHARLILLGELDIATVQLLDEQIKSTLEHGAQRILLDLRELDFIDSTGIRALLEASRLASVNGHRLEVVVSRSGDVGRVLDLVRAEDFMSLRRE
jgi:anti-anti-sigma factor